MTEQPSSRLEAAHYALLRRLSPSLRHRLMGDLQPITLLAELAERQITRSPPDFDKTRETIVKVRQQARSAVASMMNVLAWITSEENPSVMMKEGIDACMDLLRTDSEIRGVRIARGECSAAEAIVSRRALRTITAAAIIAGVDARPTPSEIVVSCVKGEDCAIVRIEMRHSGNAAHEDMVHDTRPLTWDDVQAIAADEGVELERRGEGPAVVECRIPVIG